ncbi:MAG: RDD family protein, partial [Candidatus Sericytochromatia bacterium]|nr:RDD family protein [Candidatus Sericytochromatia bacterium]
MGRPRALPSTPAASEARGGSGLGADTYGTQNPYAYNGRQPGYGGYPQQPAYPTYPQPGYGGYPQQPAYPTYPQPGYGGY